MKPVMDLAPLAVGVAAVCGVTWFLLSRNASLGPWVLAALLLAHGWVHVMFLFPKPDSATAGGPAWPFDFGRSWLIGGAGLDAGVVGAIGLVLVAITFAASLLAAMATVGFLVPVGWWSGLVVTAASGSLVVLAICVSLTFLIGFGIDLALLWLTLVSAWSPAGHALSGG